jgi:hypothetical protein
LCEAQSTLKTSSSDDFALRAINMRLLYCLGFLVALLTSLAAAAPTEAISKDFPDPSIVYDPKSSKWYAFATAGNGENMQVAERDDAAGSWELKAINILPKLGPQFVTTGIWAPDVRYLNASDSYVMYYSGQYASDTRFHCVGAATAKDSILGPWTAVQDPLACPINQGGAIDPSGFYDEESRTQWVVYKVDGNSIGHGGTCGNTVAPIVSTPIMMQQVDAKDGHTKIGDAFQVLDRGDADGPLIEAPDLVRIGDTYVLFFSSNCWSTPQYGEFAPDSERIIPTDA